jgi:hypothetical protein
VSAASSAGCSELDQVTSRRRQFREGSVYTTLKVGGGVQRRVGLFDSYYGGSAQYYFEAVRGLGPREVACWLSRACALSPGSVPASPTE